MAPVSKKAIIRAFGDLITDSPKAEFNPLKILFVASESTPYASEGGLASVVEHLSRQLINMGHDVRVFMPRFGFIDQEKYNIKLIYEGLKIPTDDKSKPFLICNVKYTEFNGIPTYFLENQEYYEKRANVYGYSDDPTRWALLSRGVLEFLKLKLFEPQLLHTNDWHTALVSNYLKTVYSEDEDLKGIATLFTIHNLSFQGMGIDPNRISEMDFDDGKSSIAPFFSERLQKHNFMRRGIIYSDAITAVSKTYSKEILQPENGMGLDKLLLELRSKLFGIINGLDYEEFNPATDVLIEQNYDINSLEKRKVNKVALQKEFDLDVADDIPLSGFVGRVSGQKGVDLIVDTLTHVLEDFDIQFVHVGGGDMYLIDMLTKLKKKFPKKIGLHPYPNFTLPRLMFAGCDLILYPSRFEPCGIVQLEAMRYGSIPVVRKVGGLADTVDNFDFRTKLGTGFVFKSFNEFSLYGQIVRAVVLYRNKTLWKQIQQNAMSQDFSWTYSAKEYEKVYKKALTFNKKGTIHTL